MFLLARFFTVSDLAIFPLCFAILFYILRLRAKRNKDPLIEKLYYRAFYFKLLCVFAFVLLSEYYFKGGDTSLYYQATQDLRAAVKDNPDNLLVIAKTPFLTYKSPLFDYFYYDNYTYDLTWNYMLAAPNFFPPKLALIPSFMFANSYLCICMVFGFFALGGTLRLFKTFYHFYPQYWRQIAFACLFLPSVTYWSSGLLKDPITFGCVGYLIYAVLSIFVLKKNYFFSILLIIFCGFLLYIIKVYILLVLVLAVLIWQFAEVNKLVQNKTLRNVFTIMTFGTSLIVGVLLLNYLTSTEAGQQYQLDKIQGNAEYQRQLYADVALSQGNNDSHFEITATNPVLLALNGISATFYRPFIWEVNSPIILLAFAESSLFLFLTIYFLFKKGIKQLFAVPFSDPRILMCFIFAFVFAIAVGISSANFGALSRYKIPCMPFYLIMILLMYKKVGLAYPGWFNKILDFAVPVIRAKRL